MTPDSPIVTPPAADQPGTHQPSPWATTQSHPGYGQADPTRPPDPWNGGHGRQESWFKRRIAPIGAAIIAFAAKFKAILLLLPKLKLLTAAGSMVVSILAYTTIWGLSFAVGFVLLLLVHEMGHVIALRREGIPASAPMFIPFLGAVISAKSLGDNAAAEARVGLAGPILGSLGAAACIVVWQVTGHDFWRALGFTGLFLNLFNLLPVLPLDGGRAMAAMAPWMWGVGLAVMVGARRRLSQPGDPDHRRVRRAVRPGGAGSCAAPAASSRRPTTASSRATAR